VIAVRDYQPGDLEVLGEVMQSAIRQVAIRDYAPEQIAAWAGGRPRGALFVDHQVWVAEADGGAVGFIDLEPDGHIDHLFVHADAQGMGAAGALYAALEGEARRRGLGRLYVEASHTARRFFERQGFELQGRQSVQVDGVALDNWRMEKTL